MDIGKFKNNTGFYEGYEDEPEIELFIDGLPCFNIHIWEGYLYDIVGEPNLDGSGWNGFTRDCNQFERTYEEKNTKINTDEYLNDLQIYSEKEFEFAETKGCFELVCSFLEYAKQENLTVLVNWW